MVYIKNNKKYSCSFKVDKDGERTVFTFDCLRRYTDTGNLLTSGVTELKEKDYDWLYSNCRQFKDFIDRGVFVKQKTNGLAKAEDKVAAQEKKISELETLLAKKTKEASAATNDTIDKLENENRTLKKELEALRNKVKENSNKNEDF